MNENVVVKLSDGNGQVIATHELKPGRASFNGLEVSAQAGGRLQLIDPATGKAPRNLNANRHGDDLVLSFGGDAQQGSVVVKDYYAAGKEAESEFRVVAETDDGSLQPIHASLDASIASNNAAMMAGGDLVLAADDNGVTQVAQAGTASGGGGSAAEAAGLSQGQMVGIGLGVLAVGAAAGGGGGGGGSSGPSAPAAPSTAATPHVAADKVLVGTTSSDNHPTFTGSGTAGDTVNLYVDNVKVATATVAANGTFTIGQAAALTDGAHSVQYSFTNAGGESNKSPASTLTVDTTAPTTTASFANYTDDAAPTTGDFGTGTITNDTSPTLHGTLSAALGAGDKILIYKDVGSGFVQVAGATVTMTGATTFDYADTGLTDGTVARYTAVVADAVNNHAAPSNTGSLSLTVSLSGPTTTSTITGYDDNAGSVTGNGLASGTTTDDTTPTLHGTLSAGLTAGQHLLVYRNGVQVDDSAAGGSHVTVSGTTWTFDDSGLTNGNTYTYSTSVADGAGNHAAPAGNFQVTVDTAAPAITATVDNFDDNVGAITGTLTTGATTDDLTPTLHFTSSAALAGTDKVDVFRDGVHVGFATSAGGNAYTFTDGGLANGNTYQYTASVTDAAGNHGTASAAFSVTTAAATTLGGTLGDLMNGDATDKTITGGAGNDTMTGGAGSDTLIGGAGADVMDGGAGGYDFVSYATAAGAVTVHLDNSGGGTGDAAGDTFANIRGVIGSDFADNLFSASQVGDPGWTVDGGNGDDTMTGGAGTDYLVGLAGADSHVGTGGVTWAKYSDSLAAVNVNLTTGVGTGGDAQGDTYTNMHYVIGTLHDDTIVGSAGADHLFGYIGIDTLSGGGGNDEFIFQVTGDPWNKTVTDFNAGDTIRLIQVVDSGAAGLTSADLTGMGVTVSFQTVGADEVMTVHEAGNPINGGDQVITFQGAAATFQAANGVGAITLDNLLGANLITLQEGGV